MALRGANNYGRQVRPIGAPIGLSPRGLALSGLGEAKLQRSSHLGRGALALEVVPLYRFFRSDPSEERDPLLLLRLRLFRIFALAWGFWSEVSAFWSEVFFCSPATGTPSLTSTSRSGRW